MAKCPTHPPKAAILAKVRRSQILPEPNLEVRLLTKYREGSASTSVSNQKSPLAKLQVRWLA